MTIVYRYIDLRDNIIKYVGIVWANNRTLDDRTGSIVQMIPGAKVDIGK